MKTHFIKRCIGISLAVVAGAFLLGFVVMHLWNWLMPALFSGAAIINYWQAMGILVLCKILFGSFHGRKGCHGGHCGHHGGHWRSRWKEKWESMSDEDREKFRKRCGDWCETDEKK